MTPRLDFAKLDRYLALRYTPSKRMAAVALKTLMPVRSIAQDAVSADPTDIVLLHPHAPGRRRHARIVASLRARGVSVREEVVPRASSSPRASSPCRPPAGTPCPGAGACNPRTRRGW